MRDMVMFLLTGASATLISLDREDGARPMDSRRFLLLGSFLWMGPPCHICCGGRRVSCPQKQRGSRLSHLFWLSLSCPFCPHAPVFLSSRRGVQMPFWASPLVVYVLMLPVPLTTPVSLGGTEETQATCHWISPMNHLFW